jgi:sugar phosphate isomerase/epimerase
VTKLDATGVKRIKDLLAKHDVSISGLGYYPNPLSADRDESEVAVTHLKKVIDGAKLLGVDVVNSFIGRDPKKTVEENWPKFLETWTPLVRHAETQEIKIAIENCPMLFTADEWPGGKNLATSPEIWRKMFQDIPSPNFGLNFDPSHFVWQQMDYVLPMVEFKDRLFHIHAKDARTDHDKLNNVGLLAYPKYYHTPKIPGQGDVNWGRFLGRLADVSYDGPVAVEVEDRAYEGSLAARKHSLHISQRYLRQFLPEGDTA